MGIPASEPDIGPERKRLNFAHAVSQHFSFLAEHGFTCRAAAATLVRYQRGGLAFIIFHGRKSYELGFEIERGGMTFPLSELLRIIDSGRAEKYRNFAARTPATLAKGLSRLAKLVKEHVEALLRNEDETLFARLADQRKQWAEDYALKVQEGQIRPRANDAFRARDYATAAELFGKIEDRLAGSDRKKLDFARAQVTRSVKSRS